jgi:hypothetical protein
MRCWVALGCLAGCATVAPMQTASTVEDGAWRVGAQLSAAAYCGSFVDGPLVCSEYPDGAPLPELRLNARRGLPRGSDLGLSVQVLGQVQAPTRPVQVGLTLEGKHELLSGALGQGRQVLSVGLLLGGAVAGRPALRPYLEVEWGLALLYGIQTARFEWMAGAAISDRAAFNEVGGHPALPKLRTERLGFTLGVLRRAPAGWGVQLGYLGDPHRFGAGAIQIQYGVFWDLPR